MIKRGIKKSIRREKSYMTSQNMLQDKIKDQIFSRIDRRHTLNQQLFMADANQAEKHSDDCSSLEH